MIKFFRKIRQQMLVENKFTKYLLYALGEIVLVVIGIFLALQLNNWNGDRKNNELVKSYKENLIADLVKDSLSIGNTIKQLKLDSANLSSYQNRVFESSAPLDTIYQIARYEYVFYMVVQLDFNDDTYEVLRSTGDIGLLDKGLIRDLSALANQKEITSIAQKITSDNYLKNLQHYSRSYPIPFQSNLIQNGSPIADIVWNQVSLVDHATDFNALILSKGDTYRLSLRYFPELQLAINELLYKLRNS